MLVYFKKNIGLVFLGPFTLNSLDGFIRGHQSEFRRIDGLMLAMLCAALVGVIHCNSPYYPFLSGMTPSSYFPVSYEEFPKERKANASVSSLL